MTTCRAIAVLGTMALLGFPGMSARAEVVAHWSFDRLENSVYPDSAGNYHATPEDANNVLTHVGAEAPFGNAVSFTGTPSGFLRIQALRGIHQNSFTVAAWVLFLTPGPNFILADWPSWTNSGFVFGVDPLGPDKSTAQPIIDLASAEVNPRTRARLSVARLALPNRTVPLNSWHHMAWTWNRDTATITCYIDGEAVGQQRKATSNAYSRSRDLAVNSRPMRIGSRELESKSFNGSIDELWVFRLALNGEQIKNLMRFNSIDGKSVVAQVTPRPVVPVPVTPRPVTPVPVSTRSMASAPVRDKPPVVAPPLAQTGKPRKYGTGRTVGIVTCLLAEVVLLSYLTWAFKARARLRAAGRL